MINYEYFNHNIGPLNFSLSYHLSLCMLFIYSDVSKYYSSALSKHSATKFCYTEKKVIALNLLETRLRSKASDAAAGWTKIPR